MFKRLILALATVAGLLSPAYSAGTIPYSLSQQFDQFGKPLAGCLLYTIKAGTTSTPQNGYQNSALTTPLPNPIICDAAGRLPQMFFADGLVKVRLTDKNGVNQVVADGIQVVGASSGGGGGVSVDPTTILATGDLKVRYGTGTLSGFVRLNGRTIGSSTSGASERANADCQALFEYLWNADSTLTVSGGRGASANADWVANKTIIVPDWRGRAMAALDDMGNTAAGRLTSSFFGSNATVLGAAGGVESQVTTKDQLPAVSPSFTGINDPITVDSTTANWSNNNAIVIVGGSSFPITPPGGNGRVTSTGSFTPRGTIAALGSGAAHSLVMPVKLATFYIKL